MQITLKALICCTKRPKAAIFISCSLLIVSLLSLPLCAQSTSLSTEGTDFWFTFLPNYHAQSSADNYVEGDSLHIYISSLTPNSGTISYVDGYLSQTDKTISWNIPTSGTIYKVTLPYTAALRGSHNIYTDGWTYEELDFNEYDNKAVTAKSFHIVADSDCSVYAVDYARTSAEAFIVLPTHVLGTDYFINTYNTHSLRSDGAGTPSQFAIVAPSNNTTVNITPTNGPPQTITLNRGETYLMQADSRARFSDMTGSQVVANKEIAVFAGHQRAAIPKELRDNPSRDCLIEQQLPLHTWGKTIALAPFTPPEDNNLFGPQPEGIYRVVAAADGTEIYEDDLLVATINAGEFYEAPLRAVVVSSNNPIMATSFMPTATNGEYGDPSMVAMPPVEQYKLDMNVMNAQIVWSQTPWGPHSYMFDQQYMMLLVDITRPNNIYIDGALQSPAIFTPIGSSAYAYANIKTTDGQHSISADLPVAVVVYGYGAHVSYGYLGGMTFFDMTNVSELNIDSCSGSATWAHRTMFATVASYEITETYNCTLTETKLDRWGIVLDIAKINEDDIAYFSIEITDINGNLITYQSDTIGFYRLAHDIPAVIDFGQQSIGTIGHLSFNITNTGTWPIIIDEHNFSLSYNTTFTIGKSNIVRTLQPNDSVVVNVYYAPNSLLHGPDTDTLFFAWRCSPVPYKAVLSGSATEYEAAATGSCDVPVRILVDSLLVSHALPDMVSTAAGYVPYSFSLPANNNISISIYDINGSLVREVVNSSFSRGAHDLPIMVGDLASGLYFVTLQVGDVIHYDKILVSY